MSESLINFVNFLGDEGDVLPSVPPLEVLDAVAGYEILSFDSGTLFKNRYV
jgi:hypothetical protein